MPFSRVSMIARTTRGEVGLDAGRVAEQDVRWNERLLRPRGGARP